MEGNLRFIDPCGENQIVYAKQDQWGKGKIEYKDETE